MSYRQSSKPTEEVWAPDSELYVHRIGYYMFWKVDDKSPFEAYWATRPWWLLGKLVQHRAFSWDNKTWLGKDGKPLDSLTNLKLISEVLKLRARVLTEDAKRMSQSYA